MNRKYRKKNCRMNFQKLSLCSAVLFTLVACAPKVSFQVQRSAQLSIDQVEFITVEKFEGVEGKIKAPSASRSTKDTLRPYQTQFTSKKNVATQSADLVRAMLLGGLSTNAPYQILNTTGEEQTTLGVLPDSGKTAILRARVKYVENRYEKGEQIPYVISIHNKGTTLEQQLLAKASAFAARSMMGAGFKEQTPYVEQIGAMEVTFELVRKSNGNAIIPPQTLRSYFVKKWGGSSDTSHLNSSQKQKIEEQYQQDQTLLRQLSSEADRVTLALEDPHTYLSQGYNLKHDSEVPQSSLALKIRLGQDIVSQYLKKITSYQEEVVLNVQGGDPAAVLLIQGNAYEEAIAHLQGLPQRKPADIYNLGLAYEASGQVTLAQQYYEEALKSDSGNSLFQDAVQRLKSQ